jgi:aminopeptidase YwaD
MDDLTRLAAEYLDTLCNRIPNRAVGAPGNRQATAYFRRVMEENGLSVESQPFDCIAFREGEIILSARDESFEAHISPYSLPCDLTAELVAAKTTEELESLDVKGKLLLLYGDIAQDQIMPRNYVFYNPEEHQRVHRALDQARPAAVISATGRNAGLAGALYPFPMFEDGDFEIPSSYMKDTEGERLLKHLGEPVHLSMDCKRLPCTAENIIARTGGDSHGRVVVTAHIDAKPTTPGALDDGGGTVVLMLLAHLLRDHQGQPAVEIASLNGEDYWSAGGEMEYVRRNQGQWQNMRLLINIDGAGYQGHPTGISYYECPKEFKDAAVRLLPGFPTITGMDPWPMGDHMIFVQNGVPAAALTTTNFTQVWQEIAHTEKDTTAIVDPALLAETARFIHAWIVALP